jgi:glycosyltransferase involved in cell wall biosynthesis
MACGLPVIAGMCGGLVDILEPGVNALICDPTNPLSIAACVSHLQRSPELQAQLREGAIRHARGRSWRATMDQLVDYYELAIRVRRRRFRYSPL